MILGAVAVACAIAGIAVGLVIHRLYHKRRRIKKNTLGGRKRERACTFDEDPMGQVDASGIHPRTETHSLQRVMVRPQASRRSPRPRVLRLDHTAFESIGGSMYQFWDKHDAEPSLPVTPTDTTPTDTTPPLQLPLKPGRFSRFALREPMQDQDITKLSNRYVDVTQVDLVSFATHTSRVPFHTARLQHKRSTGDLRDQKEAGKCMLHLVHEEEDDLAPEAGWKHLVANGVEVVSEENEDLNGDESCWMPRESLYDDLDPFPDLPALVRDD